MFYILLLFGFPNWGLGVFGAQNKVTQTRPSLGTKIEFGKLGFEGLQILWNWGLWNSSLSGVSETGVCETPVWVEFRKPGFVRLQASVSFELKRNLGLRNSFDLRIIQIRTVRCLNNIDSRHEYYLKSWHRDTLTCMCVCIYVCICLIIPNQVKGTTDKNLHEEYQA